MRKISVLFVGLAAMTSVSAHAKDCGQPPVDMPFVPGGEQASADDIRVARDLVLAYSNEVDAFINCMEQRTPLIAPYMTKDQITRRQEDLNDLHNDRRDLQIKLNEAIRAYRRAQQSS